jgi:long-subunit acyl-CoA synthetase (AMP-forming)
MEMGAKLSDDSLERRHKSMAVNECATLVYTSGTTGMPKGPFQAQKSTEQRDNMLLSTM